MTNCHNNLNDYVQAARLNAPLTALFDSASFGYDGYDLKKFAFYRLSLPPGATHEEREERSRAMLSRVLNQGNAVAVVGNGCSRPLGYPSWKNFVQGMVRRTLRVLAKPKTREGRSLRQQIEGFWCRFDGQNQPRAEHLMFLLGCCKQALAAEKRSGIYARYLKKQFEKAPAGAAENPYDALLTLPITRFMTTNYDCEIERALARHRHVPWRRFGIGSETPDDPSSLSFTQDWQHLEQLATFALAWATDSPSRVFHCHGRYDVPDSIIASEADYQRWYVADQEGRGLAFRQTMRLLLESNPLLFVGYGLNDDDLLQPLRYLGAFDPQRKEMRPCFALLPRQKGDIHVHEALFERYGIHVISYPQPRSKGRDAWGRALRKALQGIRREWTGAGKEWLQKPAPRRVAVSVTAPEPCLVTHFARHAADLEALTTRDRVDDIRAQIESGARVVGLIGPSGSGKTWNSVHLIKELSSPLKIEQLKRKSKSFAGYFLWHAYYESEGITAQDRVLAYLDNDRRRHETRLGLLKKYLLSARYLIVIDGCDRLLMPDAEPGTGRVYSALFRDVLRAAVHPTSRSVLILAGRLWPRMLDDLPEDHQEGVVRLNLDRVMASDLIEAAPFKGQQSSSVSVLCSLLDGHGYGLQLAARYLKKKPAAAGEALDKIIRALSAERSPKNRLNTMIRLTVDRVDRKSRPFASLFLRRLALFLSPFSEPTLKTCYRAVRRAEATSDVEKPPRLEGLLQKLLSEGLLRRAVEPLGSPTWTVPSSVRAWLLGTGASRGLPSFIPAGFTSNAARTAPTSAEWKETIKTLLDDLLTGAEAAAERAENATKRGKKKKRRQLLRSIDLCRDSYGLLRAQMGSNTAPRWGYSYADYMRPGVRLAILAWRLADRHWSFGARHDLKRLEAREGPLFIVELAWLYNDIGLALFCEGSLPDAYAVWEQGYEIIRVAEGVDTPGELALESHLNLTHAFIELGRLDTAKEYLEEAERIDSSLSSPGFTARIQGFQGYLEHLKGNLETADRLYSDSIKGLGEVENLRGQSFFMGRRAALKILLGDLDQGKILSDSSQAVAQAGGYPDLVAYARVPKALILAESDDLATARRELNAALQEAHRLGMRGLEAMIKGFLSRLALQQGDAEGARNLALEALRTANELGLGLVLTRSLIALALATFATGQHDLGIAYLEIARRKTNEQQYWLRAREIEDCQLAYVRQAAAWQALRKNGGAKSASRSSSGRVLTSRFYEPGERPNRRRGQRRGRSDRRS